MGQERRKEPRFHLGLSVRLVLAADLRHLEAVVVDVSRGGLYVETEESATIGRAVAVTFDGGAGRCEARGNVIRHHAGDGFAVQCMEANREFLDFLDRYGGSDTEARARMLRDVIDPQIQVL